MKSSIISSYTSHSSLHLPSGSLLDTASSHHVPQGCANSQWRTEKVSFYGPAIGTFCTAVGDCTYMLLCCFHVVVFPSYFCCFCFALPYCQPESHQRSKKVTELQYEVFELCLCEYWCIAACNPLHASKKLFRASEPIRVSNRKITCKYSIVEFLACANLIKNKK